MGESSANKRTRWTNESNEKVAQMNIDYQKEYNAQVFQREDNANQRAVADMRAAGLNPLANYAAAGSGGVAAAPQSNMHYEQGESKLQEALANLQAGTSIAESLQNIGLGAQQMQMNKEALTGQQLVNQQQRYANMYDKMTLVDRANQQKFSSANLQASYERAQYDNDYRRYYGIHEGDSPDTIRAKIIATNIIKSDDLSGYGSSFATGIIGADGNPIEFASSANGWSKSDLDSHKLQQTISAVYGEVSDKVLDSVKELLQARLGASRQSQNHQHYDYSNRNTYIQN